MSATKIPPGSAGCNGQVEEVRRAGGGFERASSPWQTMQAVKSAVEAAI